MLLIGRNPTSERIQVVDIKLKLHLVDQILVYSSIVFMFTLLVFMCALLLSSCSELFTSVTLLAYVWLDGMEWKLEWNDVGIRSHFVRNGN